MASSKQQTTRDQKARSAAVKAAASALKSAVAKVEKQIDAPEKSYAALSRELQSINRAVLRKDSAADPTLLSLLEESASDIGDAIGTLCKGAKANDLDTQIEGDRLSQAVARFADGLHRLGESVKSQCGFDDEQTNQINQFRDTLGPIVQDYFLSADNLTLALGDSFIAQPLIYPLLPLSHTCCTPGAGGGEPGNANGEFGLPEFSLFDETALEVQIDILRELLKRLLEVLLLLAIILSVMPAIFCSSDCTPPLTWMPSLVGTAAAAVPGGVRPSFTIQWDYCCQNTCFIWWTDEFVKTVTTITYLKGPVLVANIAGRTRAVRLATRFGNTFIRNVGAAANPPLAGCTPAAAYPPVPSC